MNNINRAAIALLVMSSAFAQAQNTKQNNSKMEVITVIGTKLESSLQDIS